jgi:two-component system copper resistance phosphate regulon response regulator CusR
MRILVAQNNPEVANRVQRGHVAEGYTVDVVADGSEALALAEINPYVALILEATLPGKDGFTVVHDLRRKHINTPILFLSARYDVESRVRGLDVGGDDYLPMPFSMTELSARLRALLRRQWPSKSNNVLRVADLALDLQKQDATRGGKQIMLTRREFTLLAFLMRCSPEPVSKAAIKRHAWDQHFDSGTNGVSVYIRRLRMKIDQTGSLPLIHTIKDAGFALREDGNKDQPELAINRQNGFLNEKYTLNMASLRHRQRFQVELQQI